jgi:hypothetical protein
MSLPVLARLLRLWRHNREREARERVGGQNEWGLYGRGVGGMSIREDDLYTFAGTAGSGDKQ